MVDIDRAEKGIDIHHIFPKKWCQDRDIAPRVFNSIVNKTAISLRANRKIGGRSPSDYLERIQKSKSVLLIDEKMDDILRTHCIDPKFLRSDDFQGFFDARRSTLLALVEDAMGSRPLPAARAVLRMASRPRKMTNKLGFGSRLALVRRPMFVE